VDEAAYSRLEERIDAFVEDEVEAGLIKLNTIQSKFTKAGANHGSRRLVVENQALQEHAKMAVGKMAWLIFQPPATMTEPLLFSRGARVG
jgi:hypothetical protein